MSKELPKAYEPQQYEDEIYKRWEDSGLFNPDVCIGKGITDKKSDYFSIVLPPPNVTGTLHIGHASMLAIQDLMIRYHRMKGDRTLWLPGTDHAAVATESKVEKLLIANEGLKKPKEELGKEKFLERVKQYAQNSHDTIINQSKKMGSSLDWSREAYTLDDKRNLAVRTVFKKMYDDGLIYRGYRVVNWSVKGQSTCSDDELVHVERQGKIYTFKYSEDFPITIATTRPETKLGDTAVAVHPDDTRYQKFIGQTFEVHNFADSGVDLNIKVIANEHVDMAYGTGAVGVTPAHSSVDFDMYTVQKTKGDEIDLIQVIGQDGNMTSSAGTYEGLSTLEAREKVVDALKKHNLFVSEEDTIQNVGTSDRFGDVVESIPMTQWFVNVNKEFQMGESTLKNIKKGQAVTLKKLMQEVVHSGEIKIIPERFEKIYFHWIDNLRDWCISRQIWYGHKIPVYYETSSRNNVDGRVVFKDGVNSFILNKKEIEDISNKKLGPISYRRVVKYGDQEFFRITYISFNALAYCIDNKLITLDQIDTYAKDITNVENCKDIKVLTNIDERTGTEIQDLDTLDTWFSSGLWTFSTLGYPDLNAEDLKNFHPTSVMETGYDIIFFWVARMILMTTYTLGDIPFKTVYLHGMVRDEQGRKMSKSLGNVIDPLDTIKAYGADATRLSLLIGNAPGNDLKLSEEKVAGFRNFTNKLWNITRFMIGKIQETNSKIQINIQEPKPKTLADNWILERLEVTRTNVTEQIEKYNFSMAGELLRDFTWNELADWYLEVAKVEGDKSEILNYILNIILKLWHPFMPFVTETIWQEIYGEEEILMVSQWPQRNKWLDNEISRQDLFGSNAFGSMAGKDFSLLQKIITGIRSVRAENKIEPAKLLRVVMSAGNENTLFENNVEVIKKLARLEDLKIEEKTEKPANAIGFVESGVEVFISLEGVVDFAKEKERLTKEIAQLKGYVTVLEKKLSNKEFVNNAPAEVVEKEKNKLKEGKSKLEKLGGQLSNLT
ncbi:MAG: valine--tRNA ligase [Candidatus Magasanikbacteria bacterium]